MNKHSRIQILSCITIFILSLINESVSNVLEKPEIHNQPQRHVSSLAKHRPRKIRSPFPNPDSSSNFLRDEPNLTSSEEYERDKKKAATAYQQFKLPKGYNKLAIPLSSTGSSVYVYVSIFVRTIDEVDEKNGELVLDTDFSMRWVDWKIFDSLSENGWKDPETNATLTNRTLDSEVLKEIWKPDIFIDEMSSVDRTSILSKLITLNFLADTGSSSKGDIVYSARTSLKLSCDMYFTYYPADTQTCVYYVRSYSYPMDQLRLSWSKSPEKAIFLDDPEDANFDLQISSAEPHKFLKKLVIEEKFDPYRRGNYSALQFTIKMRRKLSYHIVQTYLPSVLLIFITWLCFLIPSDMVEARIGISMTTVLTLTAMFAAVREQSPEVSYTMAIDIWMVFCIFSVFLALLMFTLIYWMKLRLSKLKEQKKTEMEIEKNARRLSEDADKQSLSSDPIIPETTYETFVDFTKKYAFWTFALLFLVFFFSYWGWLLICSGYFEWDPNPAYNAADDVDASASDDDSSNLYLYHKEAQDPNYNSEEERANQTRLLEELQAGFDELFANISSIFSDSQNNASKNGSSSEDDNSNPTTMASNIMGMDLMGNGSSELENAYVVNSTEKSNSKIMQEEMTTLQP